MVRVLPHLKLYPVFKISKIATFKFNELNHLQPTRGKATGSVSELPTSLSPLLASLLLLVLFLLILVLVMMVSLV